MFGIGLPELILIMAIALIVVGPEKLPGLAKTLARQMVELKRAANALKDSLHEDDVEPPEEEFHPQRSKIAEFTPFAPPIQPDEPEDFEQEEGDVKTEPIPPDTPPPAKDDAASD